MKSTFSARPIVSIRKLYKNKKNNNIYDKTIQKFCGCKHVKFVYNNRFSIYFLLLKCYKIKIQVSIFTILFVFLSINYVPK